MQKVLTPLERWESMTLADNFIFCKVMEENPDVCKELLEMLLNIKIERIEKPKSEYSIKITEPSRGIRFDVYVKDVHNRKFDIEIQTAHFSALPKRARYYQGVMDVNEVFSGEDYTQLGKSYVIFLCFGDIFGKGLPVYSFEYLCLENTEIKLGDEAYKIFFNAKMYDKMQSENLRSFFKFLCGKKTESKFTDKLPELINRVKMNAKWRQNYMTWEQEMRIQSRYLAEELAPELAKDLAKDMAKDMAKELAKDMAKDMAKDLAKDMAKDLAKDMAKDLATDIAKDMAKDMAKDIAKDMAKDLATDIARDMAKDLVEEIVDQKIAEKRLETAKNLILLNLTAEQIALATNLTVKQVEQLMQE